MLVKLRILLKAHILNPLWHSRSRRREVRQGVMGTELTGYYKRNYMSGISRIPEGPVVKDDASDKIYSIWLQGENAAPPLVQACFRSIRKHCSQELAVLDAKTLKDCISLPEAITREFETGKMKPAHYADICRLELLYEYGGYWMDSTDFATGPIPKWIEDEDFFVFMVDQDLSSPYIYRYSYMQNCFIRARKGDYLLAAWREMLLDYWSHQSRKMDYFQHQLMFKALVNNDPRAQKHFARMPEVNQDPTHVLISYPLDTPYEADRFATDTAGAFFQKLKYSGADKAPAGSIYDFIIKSE